MSQSNKRGATCVALLASLAAIALLAKLNQAQSVARIPRRVLSVDCPPPAPRSRDHGDDGTHRRSEERTASSARHDRAAESTTPPDADSVGTVLRLDDIAHVARIALHRESPSAVRQAAALKIASMKTPTAMRYAAKIVNEVEDDRIRKIVASGLPDAPQLGHALPGLG